MSCIVDMRRIALCMKFVLNFFKSLFKKHLPLKFPVYDLKYFLNSWNEMKIEKLYGFH